MTDIWSFLLQTLTVSGVAALILGVKALFKDKLPPKWQFSVWSVVGLMMLLPAGLFGQYSLIRWQIPLEVIKSWCGVYDTTRVLFPIPLVTDIPRTLADWLFVIYVLGVVASLVGHIVAYIRLKRALRRGSAPSDETLARIRQIAAGQGIKLGRVIEAEGLPGAFVVGVLRPTLVLPARWEPNESIILHELFHLKHRDTLWNMLICALRCLHWCNPLVRYCADRALTDLECRCDQYVLEILEGEDRRQYGHILLSMANDRFSRTPGCTGIHNGGKHIRARIEHIARFKLYPKGMKLVSVCLLIILAFTMAVGAQATTVLESDDFVRLSLATARSTPCTTPAGAFDAYGKAVLDQNGYYRAMCAPDDMQEDILTEMLARQQHSVYPTWDSGLDSRANSHSGYYIFNFTKINEDAYEGLLVVELLYPPEGKGGDPDKQHMAARHLRAERQKGRWVIEPLEDFWYVETIFGSFGSGCTELPGTSYTAEFGDFLVEVVVQTIHTVDSTVTKQQPLLSWSTSSFDTVPKPHAEFTHAYVSNHTFLHYVGPEERRTNYTRVGVSYEPWYEGEERPTDMMVPTGVSSGGSNTGASWTSNRLSPGWESPVEVLGGSQSIDPEVEIRYPASYAADFYINDRKVAELDLIRTKGESK